MKQMSACSLASNDSLLFTEHSTPKRPVAQAGVTAVTRKMPLIFLVSLQRGAPHSRSNPHSKPQPYQSTGIANNLLSPPNMPS
jgi:hypothetical protein